MHGFPSLIGDGGRVLDLAGVGFGPSNLALAVALREADAGLAVRFLEKRDRFVWHGNMLLDGSRMQISFLKDLVSLRDPTSRYSFLNYLHRQGRLQDFINLRTFYPSRREFNDYLSWVAADFDGACDYGMEAVAVEPVRVGDSVPHVRIRARDAAGRERSLLARNVVVGAGATPMVPDAFDGLVRKAAGGGREAGGPLVIHSNDYLAAAGDLARAGRVAVVGLGQSAAEIFLDLHARGVDVDIVARGPAMRPADSSPFANQVFDAGYTTYLYGLPPAGRAELLRAFHNTNYAVVDPDLIDAIYGIFYQQKVEGSERHGLLTRHDVVAARPDAATGGVLLDLASLDGGERRECRYGAVVLATGYRRRIHEELLRPMEPWLTGGEVGRDYRLPTVPGCTAGLYLQGCCEATHGLSDTLLSILPIRAQEIATALTGGTGLGRGQQIRELTSAQ
ncbi:ornithine monooxygenase [Azospirillum sp. TSH100]|uniref:lysine N(6)-hydroxylase/L-ornithine N(5)-oxygenase family protein n=1 Tax=Azospirillum sp. TSH100 TaxID=652764 RepID=UPI000D61B3BA|nr:lysine N(6)-hydroxylase/L-ornithine N(5)-oxygenase family protein [Azospirillum sp. TSH100]PWC83253.1 ornithine monooxygenase [Azospirillum sp. TSH100]QCG91745.1 ornithine monooxygenase [Azospirillum sp. TSH100]